MEVGMIREWEAEMVPNGYKRIQTDTKDKGKLAQYSVLLYPKDVEAATAKAREQGLSFSALVRDLVIQYVAEGGRDGSRK